MKKIAMILTVLFLAAGTSVFSQDKDPKTTEGKGMHKGEMGIPGLTDQQKAEIKKLKTSHMKEVLPLKNLLMEKKAHLKTISTVENPDIAAINKTIDEIGALQVDLMKKREAFRQGIRKQLNEEQRMMFDIHGMKGMKGMKGNEPGGKGRHGKGPGMGKGKCNMGEGSESESQD
jgi:Spy/CpxP family protein refolding chaperone